MKKQNQIQDISQDVVSSYGFFNFQEFLVSCSALFELKISEVNCSVNYSAFHRLSDSGNERRRGRGATPQRGGRIPEKASPAQRTRIQNPNRENLRASKKEYNKTEDDLKSLQSVGQIIGEVLRPLDHERSNLLSFYKLLLIITINFQIFQ
uniref:Uncharacterized protein n=1 Tax=Nicotiana tabacum TaxID=4097 RepID=A0A1S4CLC8_TOBAC|nr:PREDICTED: uncharacterized protein LOC107820153 [Nicotiana tabacum]